MNKSRLSKVWRACIGAAVLLVALAGCGGAGAVSDTVKFALVVPNPIGDRSYVDAGHEGFKRAEAELDVEATLIETTGVPEHEPAIRGVANQGFDIIVTMGMDPDMLLAVETAAGVS